MAPAEILARVELEGGDSKTQIAREKHTTYVVWRTEDFAYLDHFRVCGAQTFAPHLPGY